MLETNLDDIDLDDICLMCFKSHLEEGKQYMELNNNSTVLLVVYHKDLFQVYYFSPSTLITGLKLCIVNFFFPNPNNI